MKRLRWDSKARDDLAHIIRYFSDKDPRLSTLLLQRIGSAADRLVRFDTGRPGRMPKLREKSVLRTKYILAYRVTPKQIIIVRVLHSSQNWTSTKWPDQ